MNGREVLQGQQGQGTDERIAYSITTTPWCSSPTNPSVVVWDVTVDASGTDVTSTVMPINSPNINGDVITLSLLRALVYGRLYRVEVQFTSGGNVFECFFFVMAER